MFSHIFPTIRIVKFASSQRLPQLRAGTARKHEEPVFLNRKKGDPAAADQKVLNENEMFVKVLVARSETRYYSYR